MYYFKLYLSGVAVIGILSFFSNGLQAQSDNNSLQGYWHAKLDGNQSIGVTLYFYTEDDALKGKTFFSNENQLSGEGSVQNLTISGKSIEFDIPKQGTHFKGKLSEDIIKGGFYTPGNPVLKLNFIKFELKDIPAAQEIQASCNPYEFSKLLTSAELNSDFNMLKKALQTHPQIYFYITENEIEQAFAKVEKKLGSAMTRMDFIRLVAPLVAKLKCYHTQLLLPEKFINGFLKETKSIPLEVAFIEDKANIKKCFEVNNSIEPGTEILEINGLNINLIRDTLFKFISADGNNSSYKNMELNRNFWMLYHYIESPESFKLKIKAPSTGIISEVIVKAMESKQIVSEMSSNNNTQNIANQLPFSFSKINNIGILKVKTFNYFDLEQYKKKLSEFFKEIEKEQFPFLIVDLRGNTGGHPELAADLLSYFISSPAPYLNQPNDKRYANLLKPLQPKGVKISSTLFFLCDGNSLSSTGHFLSFVKSMKLGLIIGDTPGGSFVCNDEAKLFDLPYSGLQVAVAQTTFSIAIKGLKKGDEIIPDHLIKPTVSDILKGNDAVMNFAVGLCK